MNEEENQFLNGLAKEKDLDLWIGLHDDDHGSNWFWEDGSNLDSYSNWNYSQPDDMGGYQHCGQLQLDLNGHWNDESCDNNTAAFVCKILLDVCPDGWKYHEKKCYFVSEISLPRSESEKACKEFNNNSDLVTLNNDEENEYFTRHYLGCEDGWLLFDETCYYLKSNNGSYYDEAISRCNQLGAQLTSIYSQAVNEFLFSHFQSDKSAYWIGINDKEHPGKFSWSDQSTIVYTNWFKMEHWISEVDQCVYMDTDTPKWVLDDCTSEHNYICMKPPEAIEEEYTGCNEGDKYFRGSCYSYPNLHEIWDKAKQTCENMESRLARIEDEHEGAFFTANMMDFNEDVWTDVKVHKYSDDSHDFIFDDGSLVEYLPWDEKEPSIGGYECVLATGGKGGESGLYQIITCDTPLSYFCEYDREGYTTLPPTPTPTHGTFCLEGWDHDQGKCYKTFTDLRSWERAEDICQTYGGHLASINSKSEETEVGTVIERVDLGPFVDSVWVGLQLNTLADKHWTDGSSIDYLHWADGQPEMDDHENCATVDQYKTRLQCTICESHLPFVCEVIEGAMVTTMTPPSTEAPTLCDDGGEGDWYLHNDHCYKFISQADEDPQSFQISEKLCQKEGAHLTSVVDINENIFIEAMISQTSDDGFWLGGRATEDAGFYWLDGNPFVIDLWADGEPNHFDGQEDCIEMYNRRKGEWNDKNCGHERGRVCKRPHGATVPPVSPTTPPPGNCPEDWIPVAVTGKCMKFVTTDEHRFDTAKSKCRKIHPGAELASFHDQKEMAYAIAFLVDDAWIGLTYDFWQFVWVDQTPVDFTQWAPGEPSDHKDGYSVKLNYPSALMEDKPIAYSYHFICGMERDPEITEPSTLPKCDAPYGNYFEYAGECYRAVATKKSFQDAEETCKGEGSHLTSMFLLQENAFNWIISFDDQDTYHPWIGLNDLKTPKTFEWIDGWPAIYTNWGNDQPQVNSSDKHCVRLSSDNGLWYNEQCDDLRPFICKQSQGESPTTSSPVVGHCPDDTWSDIQDNYCYIYVDQEKSWNDAHAYCTFLDADLISIHSSSQNKILKLYSQLTEENIWIGLIQKKSGLGWSDGTAYNYFNWHSGEPSGESEMCTEFFYVDGTWNDDECYATKRFVCRTPKVLDETTTLQPHSSTTPGNETTTTSEGSEGTTEGSHGDDGLGGGAIFGIVFAVLVVLAGIGVGIFYCIQNKKNNNSLISTSTGVVGNSPKMKYSDLHDSTQA